MRIGIVAGEISGDRLGAGLIKEIKKRHPKAEFIGIGGESMIAAGCKSLFPLEKLSVMGLVEVISHYWSLRKIHNALLEEFSSNPPDVFVGIDYKEFNLSLSEKLKANGIKTVQYVSPQVWAWRPWRVKRIARSVDQILSVLPFEAPYYEGQDVKVSFVGHPLADQIPLETDQTEKRQALQLDIQNPVIALLPGSRRKEWDFHMSLFLETAACCVDQRPDCQFIIALVNEKAKNHFVRAQQEFARGLPEIQPVVGKAQDVITASDVVLCVSGTATLEIMLLKRPMVIAYRMAGLTHAIAKRLVKLPYIGLPSLLAEKQTAPEFIQNEAQVESLRRAIFEWLDDEKKRKETMALYDQIHRNMRLNADKKAAEVVLKLCHD